MKTNIQFCCGCYVQHMYDVVVRNGTEVSKGEERSFSFSLFEYESWWRKFKEFSYICKRHRRKAGSHWRRRLLLLMLSTYIWKLSSHSNLSFSLPFETLFTPLQPSNIEHSIYARMTIRCVCILLLLLLLYILCFPFRKYNQKPSISPKTQLLSAKRWGRKGREEWEIVETMCVL